MPPEAPSSVPCPDCGQYFIARGISAHRRQKHGVSVQAPLPAPVPDSMVHEILSAIELLRGAVERIDERMRTAGPLVVPRESAVEEVQRLERELAVLLEEIACVQRLASIRSADPAQGPHSDELSRLRREQARLVYRIDEIKRGAPNEERFLS